jgi:hypothetical protein
VKLPRSHVTLGGVAGALAHAPDVSLAGAHSAAAPLPQTAAPAVFRLLPLAPGGDAARGAKRYDPSSPGYARSSGSSSRSAYGCRPTT